MPPGPVIVSSASRCSWLSEPWISLPISRRACLRDRLAERARRSRWRAARRSAPWPAPARAGGGSSTCRPRAGPARRCAPARRPAGRPRLAGRRRRQARRPWRAVRARRSSRARGSPLRAARREGRRSLGLEIERSSNSCSARSALSPCSSPTALHASLTSSRSAALLEPRVASRQRAQLAGPRLAPVALAEEAGGAVDVFGARGPAARQLLGDAADLEVAAVPAGAPLDRQAQLAQVGGQLRPVPGAVLAGGAVEPARFDRGELAVGALGGEEDEVGVQLGVGDAAGLLVSGRGGWRCGRTRRRAGSWRARSAPPRRSCVAPGRPRARFAPARSPPPGGGRPRSGRGGRGRRSPRAPRPTSAAPSSARRRRPWCRWSRPGAAARRSSGEKPCITARRSLRSTGLFGSRPSERSRLGEPCQRLGTGCVAPAPSRV